MSAGPGALVARLAHSRLYSLFPQHVLESLKSDLAASRSGFSARAYANLAVLCAVAVLVACLFVSSLALGLLESMALSALAGLAALAVALKLPAYAARQYGAEFDSDVASGLLEIRLNLSAGAAFETAMSRACEGNGVFGRELGAAVRAARSGVSMQSALQPIAQVRSPLAQRAAGQLAFEYSHGGDGSGLSALASEALSRQQALARQYASRLSFYSVLFVGASAVLPSLFCAYLILSSSFMEPVFGQAEVIAVYAVVFPLLSLSIAFLARSGAPKSLNW